MIGISFTLLIVQSNLLSHKNHRYKSKTFNGYGITNISKLHIQPHFVNMVLMMVKDNGLIGHRK